MQVRDLGLGTVEITPHRFSDARGYVVETWQRERFVASGIDVEWVQENQSFSADRNTLRGLHLQCKPYAQAKLVRVLKGSIFDVAVDVRKDSPTIGRWVSCILSAQSLNQLFIPQGFAHGFLTLEPGVEVIYKVSSEYASGHERNIMWNDPDLSIDWPLGRNESPILSEKDANALSFASFLMSSQT